ncbi:MAG: pyridoxal phosphate-dependent aminotransferase [Planctomycetota bacterium]
MPDLPLSDRASRVSPSITMAVTSKAKALKAQGVDVVSFGAGEPDFDTPAFIKDQAKASIDAGMTKYTPNPSIPELKQAVVAKFQRDNGLTFTPDQISIGPGGKGVLYFAFLALLNDGDEVLIPTPYWVSYPEQAKICGGVPTFVKGEQANDFKITPDQLDAAITPRTRLFILNSPSNPAGNCYTPAELQDLADVLAKHPHVVVFSDEIYEHLLYDGQKTASIASLHPDLPARTITFNCHSKSFAMTGWRLGYAGGPEHVIKAMNKLQGQINSHVTSFCQPAAALALTDPRGAEAVEAMRVEFEKRGRHMHERLSAIDGIDCIQPRGAFYCFPDVSAHFAKAGVDDAVGYAAKLLEEQHVAVVPGNDSGFDTHVRLSFATSMEQIDKGLDRLSAFVQGL